MDVETKAKIFAINAHKGQVRKGDIEKPMILHPINVANILMEYGYEGHVVAAGYLHDVVEDTGYTIEDIRINFKDKVASLVEAATEPDKSKSWEQRKEQTIHRIKMIDLDHKAVVCADKISNLEDMEIMFGLKNKKDFGAFKRGFKEQKWYYEHVYESLIYNEDENNPMFVRLRKLIDLVFGEVKDDTFIKENLITDKKEYKKLNLLHYKKKEVCKLKSLIPMMPYVIEFVGTPRTGKTSLVLNIKDFFEKGEFDIESIDEFTSSRDFKYQIKPRLQPLTPFRQFDRVGSCCLKQLKDSMEGPFDVILADRSVVDRLIWTNRAYHKNILTFKEYQSYKRNYMTDIRNRVSIVIATTASPLVALQRDYYKFISLEPRVSLTLDNVSEYNESLKEINVYLKKNGVHFATFDTDNRNQREVLIEVIDVILKDMKKQYMKQINAFLNQY